MGPFRNQCLDAKAAGAAGLDESDAQVEAEIEDAVEFAENSPGPEPAELFADVYADA